MKYDLSVLVPGIRTENWRTLYNSILKSFRGTWEIIFVGPYLPPEDIKQEPNVRYIQDWGSPIRCQQRALITSEGDWITWAADDGEFYPEALDMAFANLAGEKMDKKTLVMGKYFEGELSHVNRHMAKMDYYVLSNHDASTARFLPKNYLMLNVGVVSRELLFDVGGWDCRFEVCPIAYNDLAIRLQNYGVKFIIQDEMMFHCSHSPGHEGDHGPVHDAQVFHDQPLFAQMYNQRECVDRIKIDLYSWEKTSYIWERRFKSAGSGTSQSNQ